MTFKSEPRLLPSCHYLRATFQDYGGIHQRILDESRSKSANGSLKPMRVVSDINGPGGAARMEYVDIALSRRPSPPIAIVSAFAPMRSPSAPLGPGGPIILDAMLAGMLPPIPPPIMLPALADMPAFMLMRELSEGGGPGGASYFS